MKKFLFFSFFLILDCSKSEVIIKEPHKVVEDIGKLSTYGPIVYINGPDIKEFTLHFYTEAPEKSKLTVFRPEGDVHIEEKTNFTFHYFNLKKVNELTVFQIFS